MTGFLYRHRKALLILTAAGALLVGLGVVDQLVFGGGVRGVWCAYQGARAWISLRHAHPLWTAYHLWRGTHDCKAVLWH